MQYMLDTDICSYAIKVSSTNVQQRLEQVSLQAVCVSVVTKAELLYGLALRDGSMRYRFELERFLGYVPILEFPDEAAAHYAGIRAALKRSGRMIGANDLFVAAHARSLGLTLVTNNVREFGRVPGLKVENWAGMEN